jgi:hypothetical protein
LSDRPVTIVLIPDTYPWHQGSFARFVYISESLSISQLKFLILKISEDEKSEDCKIKRKEGSESSWKIEAWRSFRKNQKK